MVLSIVTMQNCNVGPSPNNCEARSRSPTRARLLASRPKLGIIMCVTNFVRRDVGRFITLIEFTIGKCYSDVEAENSLV